MAWSGPDVISLPSRVPPDVEWTREGSTLSQAVYWGGFQTGHWRVDGGAWMQWRNPAKDGGYSYATGSTGPDSIVQLRAQDFRAAKFAFEFSCKPSDLLTLGFRYDYFLYLDPHAHANTLEPLTNEALSQCNANHTCNLPKWLPIILMIPFLVVLFRCTCISD